MPTIRLIPSTYYLSSTQYLSVSNESNMYNNTDNTTYATVTNNRNQTSSYYIYIRGFNFDDVPSDVTVNSFTIKFKAYERGVSTSTDYRPYLCNDTTTITGDCNVLSTSVQTLSFSGVTADWETIKGYDSNFGIRINCRRASKNTTGYVYIYGVEIEVDYTPNVKYNIISTNNSANIDSISPEGLTEVVENDNYTLNIYGSSIDNIEVLDNGTDVTNSLVQHTAQLGEITISKTAESFTTGFSGGTSMSFYTSSSSANNNFNYAVGNTAENPGSTSSGSGSWTYVKDNGSSTNNTGYGDFVFDFSDIPEDAIINSIQVKCYGAVEDASQTTSHADITLFSGNTQKGTTQSFTSSTNSIITISNAGTWTREELQEAKLRFAVGYYGGHIFGITWNVTYELPVQNPYYWTYTLSNVQGDHTIVINDSIIEIPEEDPQYNYYPITISSINATTDPNKGTTRVVEGTNQTITIYPSDPQITLVTDNGVDITSQLVAHGGTISDPTIETAPGASYGFNLNSSTEYYVSTNNGVNSSASVCRVTFNLPVRCLVTFQYINYAEATYDFGVFGKIDTTLSTNGWTASNSGGDSTTDAGLEQIRLNTNSSNSSTPQTLTYEIPSGEHYIDIKYGKDQASDDGNDSLQWKILSIEPLESNNYYTYTLSNIQEEHSLIFIFGDVTYYFVNSSGTNCKLFPSGSLVQLPGDNYSLTIVPDNYNYQVTMTDNNVSVTPTRKEEEITKDGNTYTVVNYVYTLTNIQATHNLIVTCVPSIVYYLKLNSIWEEVTDILLKQDNRWGSTVDLANIFTNNLVFYKGNL